MKKFDVIIVGAGAAGLMCAIEAGKRGRSVCVLDHAKKPAEKIRISGGGRCNFTNIYTAPQNFISGNSHFSKSALKRYTQYDFIDMVESHRIAYHEKTLGQQFCDDSAKDIIKMLLDECARYNVQILMEHKINSISSEYVIDTNNGSFESQSVVIATGGPSIPKMGASEFAYKIARQFGLGVTPTQAALVPLTFESSLLEKTKELSGISVDAIVSCNGTDFREGLLFTHRGISGPSILQISSYWNKGDEIIVNLAPDTDALAFMKDARETRGKQNVLTVLCDLFPRRLAQSICLELDLDQKIGEISGKRIIELSQRVNAWRITPKGTEGYRTAEVTRGGIDTQEISSKTFEAKKATGLYFIGECVDVTGHLGGFNFQWAWSSGWCAGQFV